MTPLLTTAGRIAEIVGGTCEGAADRPIRGVASLETAGPDELSFCAGGRHAKALSETRAGIVILAEGSAPVSSVVIRHPNPRLAFAVAASRLRPPFWPAPSIDPRAAVHSSACVDGATIEAFVFVGDGAVLEPGAWVQAHAYVGAHVRIGAKSRIMPHAVLLEGCRLGERVVVKPGAVVGGDGFGHVRDGKNVLRMPHFGGVVVEDDVEIGANACVDRAVFGDTVVERFSRLDNLVQVAHNVRVGAASLLAAFVGIAGGARIGRETTFGGRAAVVDGVRVGDGAVLLAMASASRDVPPGATIGGSPAQPHRTWLKQLAALRTLPARLRDLDRVEAKLREIEERIGGTRGHRADQGDSSAP